MERVPASRGRQAAAILAAMVLAFGPHIARADDLRDFPARIGRLFRLEPRSRPAPKPTSRPDSDASPLSEKLNGSMGGRSDHQTLGSSARPAVETPPVNGGGAAPRLVAQPRVTRPITEADPLLTRIAIGRSDNGQRFGMFLQIFADGTVLDSEGIHRVGPDVMGGLNRAISDGDILRKQGHCGGPSTDFIEMYQVVVYERTMRGLRATTLSYTGNMQPGCDPSLQKLHQAIEAVVMKLAAPAQTAAAPAGTSPAPPPRGAASTFAPPIAPGTITARPAPTPADPLPLPLIDEGERPAVPAVPANGGGLPPIQNPGPTSIPLTPLPG